MQRLYDFCCLIEDLLIIKLNKGMKKNYLKLSMMVLALGAMTFFSSCLKNDNDYTPQPRSGLFVLHASPGVNAVDVFLNDTKITKGQALGYTEGGSLSVTPDAYTFNFAEASNNDKTVASYEADSLVNGDSYSVILYDTGSVKKVMFIKNTFQGQTSGAYIRFLHLSPDAGMVTINMDETPLFSERTFADNLQNSDKAKFQAFSGSKYSFTAINAQGDTIDQLKKAQMKTNNFYTLYLDGLDSATEPTDSLQWKLRLKAM